MQVMKLILLFFLIEEGQLAGRMYIHPQIPLLTLLEIFVLILQQLLSIMIVKIHMEQIVMEFLGERQIIPTTVIIKVDLKKPISVSYASDDCMVSFTGNQY